MYEFSPFWYRKMDHLFTIVDFNEDDYFELRDMQILAERHIKAIGLEGVPAKQLTRKFERVWYTIYERFAIDGKISRKALPDVIKASGRENLDKAVIIFFVTFFDTLDTNGDGVIEPSEFAQLFKMFKLEKQDPTVAFKKLDTNHNGVINAEEYMNAAMQFFTSDNESDPGTWFFGSMK